ncbi:MAG: signal peptide peptidase SppA [Verrucomicrobiales bacterium]
MAKKLLGCALVGGAVVLVLVVVFALVVGSIVGGVTLGPKIANIDLEGIITSNRTGGLFETGASMVDRIKEDLSRAVEDESVKAIVLRINSPGGEVTASDTIHRAVSEAREAKPVVVYMDAMAASGGYYVACAADEIYANETTLTGSIGVIIQTLSYYDLFGKIGLGAVVFTSGEFKDSLGGARELRPEERDYIQSLVDQMYEKFLGIVAQGREIEEKDLRRGIADGRVFTGAQALEENLVDANGYVEDAYARARELADAPDAKVVRYRRETGLLAILGSARARLAGVGSKIPGRLEIDIAERILPRLEPGMIYLLPSHYAP